MDWAFASTVELADAIRVKLVSSREVTELYLRRIEERNPALNAVVTVDAERALERAAQADEALAHSVVWGPLHGVPFTVKDSFETAGLRTTAGAPELADHVPERDADPVARLRGAGAVVLGKTNLPSWAMDVQTFNPVFGCSNNPWDPGRTTGGSSGGAAAALAAGLTGGDIGSDIGGSIRNPSSHCGVFGHRPTHHIVPDRGHIPGPPGTLSRGKLGVSGPMGRSAADLDLGLSVLAGPFDDDAVAWRLELPPARFHRPDELRVAAWIDDPSVPIDGAVHRVLDRLCSDLAAAGVAVDRTPALPVDLHEVFSVYVRLLGAETSSGRSESEMAGLAALAADPPEDADPFLLGTARGATQRYCDWQRANEHAARLAHAMAGLFEHYDVLLLPAFATPAFPHDHGPQLQRHLLVDGRPSSYWPTVLFWASLATGLNLPASVAPAGLTPEGLPVGAQLVGPYLHDRTCTAAAAVVERVVGRLRPPGF
jgi:amidase